MSTIAESAAGKTTQMAENQNDWTTNVSGSELQPIKYMALKKALVRFAKWAGWLTFIDDDTLRLVLSYSPQPKQNS